MKYGHLTFLVFLSFWGITLVISDLYLSVHRLEELAKYEPALLAGIKKYVDAQPLGVPANIVRFINETEAIISNKKDVSHDIRHPINTYHLVERFVFYWLYLFEKLACKKCTKVTAVKDFKAAHHAALHNITRLPVMRDLNGTMRGILRLWRTYKLDINKLMQGEVLGYRGRGLTHKDVVRLIMYAAEHPEFYYEEIVLRTQMVHSLKGTRLYHGGLFELASAYYRHGFINIAKTILESLLPLGDQTLTAAYDYCLKHPDVNVTKTLTAPESDKPSYEALCRGEIKSPKELSKLNCNHRRTLIPIYWSKEEIFHHDPRISLFHDVISDREIDMVLKSSVFQLTRRYSKDSTIDENEDVLATSWLSELKTKAVVPLTRRIQLITGLSTHVSRSYSDSENYEINNFGVGGMQKPHVDFLNISLGEYQKKEERSIRMSGDRVATWVFYLSDVERGGATVFPEIRVRVPVIKGAALFWYNIKRNNDKDQRSLNAECPVAKGSKFVCKKWILEAGQLFRRKCGLSPVSIDT
ncbi:prolyl 4-hydroxylase subunit alpha-1-like [Saccostrea cucullata]|uniref:prolyl 4-hydroxylase subunit alpha-1-like n=1 Tax=Saccostrea cuccullata TaxID=36930 RepID=UPI002ECFD0E5